MMEQAKCKYRHAPSFFSTPLLPAESTRANASSASSQHSAAKQSMPPLSNREPYSVIASDRALDKHTVPRASCREPTYTQPSTSCRHDQTELVLSVETFSVRLTSHLEESRTHQPYGFVYPPYRIGARGLATPLPTISLPCGRNVRASRRYLSKAYDPCSCAQSRGFVQE